MDASSTIFLLLCLASYFPYFLLPSPGMVTYLLRGPSSVQQSSATLSKYVRVYLVVYFEVYVFFWVPLASCLISGIPLLSLVSSIFSYHLIFQVELLLCSRTRYT